MGILKCLEHLVGKDNEHLSVPSVLNLDPYPTQYMSVFLSLDVGSSFWYHSPSMKAMNIKDRSKIYSIIQYNTLYKPVQKLLLNPQKSVRMHQWPVVFQQGKTIKKKLTLPARFPHCLNLWTSGQLEINLSIDTLSRPAFWKKGVSENSVPLNPMVLLIIIPIKWLFHWEYTPFSDIDIPKWVWIMVCLKMSENRVYFPYLYGLSFVTNTRIFTWKSPPEVSHVHAEQEQPMPRPGWLLPKDVCWFCAVYL